MNDGVEPYVEGNYIRARGTSLGGDDGIGVATALALLEDENIAHPKLQFICTNDEETTTSGAINLSKDAIDPNTKVFQMLLFNFSIY